RTRRTGYALRQGGCASAGRSAGTGGVFDRRVTDAFRESTREYSPFVDLDRAAWSRLREQTPLPLTAAELEQVRGLGDFIDLDEVRDIYLPLSRLLNLRVAATARLHEATERFLGQLPDRPPYVLRIGGAVAVGKSTTAR